MKSMAIVREAAAWQHMLNMLKFGSHRNSSMHDTNF